MSLSDITNHLAVSENLASSGQPDGRQFKAIAAAGFDVVINLAMPNSEDAIPEEGYLVTARGMSYVHLPVPFDAPSAGHLRSFFALMAAFDGSRCWVHCALNYRVSAFLYQYFRLVRKLDPEEARRVIIPGWRPDPVWQAFMALEEGDVAR